MFRKRTAFCDNLIISLFSINLFNFHISATHRRRREKGKKKLGVCFLDSGFNSIKTRCPSTEAAFIQTCWFWSRMQDFFPGEWKVNVHDLQKMHGAGGGEPAGSRLGKRLCGLHIFSLPRSSQLSLLNLQHIKEGSARGGMCQDPTV